MDPTNPRESYFALIKYVTALQVAFTNNRGAILQGVVKASLSTVLTMGRQLDANDTLQRTSYLSTLLLKMFNNIRAEKSLENSQQLSKKSVILFVANILCRSYYMLHTESSCANVFSNIHTANLKFSSYARAEQVEYRYILGRFYLAKEQLTRAYDHLSWAFRKCLPRTPQQRLILKYLVPAAMLLGRLPTNTLLSQFNLQTQYGPLAAALKAGNYARFMEYLLNGPCSEWYVRARIQFLFRNRTPIVLLRQIVYRTWVILNRPNVLKFDQIQAALRVAMAGSSESFGWYSAEQDASGEITENVLITLVSQRFVMGHVYSRRALIKLKDKGPFPAMARVHNLDSRTGKASTDRWLET